MEEAPLRSTDPRGWTIYTPGDRIHCAGTTPGDRRQTWRDPADPLGRRAAPRPCRVILGNAVPGMDVWVRVLLTAAEVRRLIGDRSWSDLRDRALINETLRSAELAAIARLVPTHTDLAFGHTQHCTGSRGCGAIILLGYRAHRQSQHAASA